MKSLKPTDGKIDGNALFRKSSPFPEISIGFLLLLLFLYVSLNERRVRYDYTNPEDGVRMYLRNSIHRLPKYTMPQFRRQ
jgi:hypothetical protein